MSLHEWSRWLSRRPPVLIIVLPLAYGAITLALGWYSGKWSETIYFLTGLILIWYTIEAHATRKEITRQTELQTRPFLSISAAGTGFDATVTLANGGKGMARNI